MIEWKDIIFHSHFSKFNIMSEMCEPNSEKVSKISAELNKLDVWTKLLNPKPKKKSLDESNVMLRIPIDCS